MTIFTRVMDKVFGRAEHAITVPALDGAFRPNSDLDKTDILEVAANADNLAMLNGAPVFSTGCDLRSLDGKSPVKSFAAPVACIASLTKGAIALICEDGQLHFMGGDRDNQSLSLPVAINCPTAITVGKDGILLIANGSSSCTPAQWQTDLLRKGRSGSIWQIAPGANEPRKIAQGLAWPAGLAVINDKLIAAESWASRLVEIRPDSSEPIEVLGNLPGYPSRMTSGSTGFWLTLFAPRNQLVEFVLRENAYRARMMGEIDPDLWIAPTLRSGRGFLEPLQAGGVKQLGVLKPWAPVLSYGLVAEINNDFIPQRSFHSRADGRRHGVTSCLQIDNNFYFTARGDGVVGQLKLEASA